MYNAIMFAHEEIKKICAFLQKIVDEIGKPKFEYEHVTVDQALFDDIRDYAEEQVKQALDTDDKTVRDARLLVVYEDVYVHFEDKYPQEEYKDQIDEALYKLQKTIVRNWIMYEKKRVDGRGILELRPLSSEVGLLPRAARKRFVQQRTNPVFVCNHTWLLSETLRQLTVLVLKNQNVICTSITSRHTALVKHRPSRGPGRREIGHGALAERALVACTA